MHIVNTVKGLADNTIKNMEKWYYRMGKSVYCPICATRSRAFAPHDTPPRANARCSWCGSLERHRFVWLFLSESTDFFFNYNKRILHFAPEREFHRIFQGYFGGAYVSADLDAAKAMVQMDVCHINYPDNYFDVIICNHVLEHVGDDRIAMNELLRVLAPNGWAIITVPIVRENAFESPFARQNHVETYGPDFKDRLESTGFIVNTIHPLDQWDQNQLDYMGINAAAGEIFLCGKISAHMNQYAAAVF